MKRILFYLFTIVALNCVAQQSETTAVLDADGNLVGIATKDDFLEAPFNEWFSFNYENYEINEVNCVYFSSNVYGICKCRCNLAKI